MYNLFKLLHIVAAMVWVGGTLALVVINSRLSRSQNRAAMEGMAQQADFYGRMVLGPAAGITLIAGILTAVLGHIRFNAIWIIWGVAGLAASLVLGAVFIRRTNVEISKLAAAATGDQQQLVALRRRLGTLYLINLVLLLSVVSAMVFKPY